MDLMSNGNIQGRYTTKIQFSGTEQCYYNFDFQHLIDIDGVVEFLRNHCGSLSSFIFLVSQESNMSAQMISLRLYQVSGVH